MRAHTRTRMRVKVGRGILPREHEWCAGRRWRRASSTVGLEGSLGLHGLLLSPGVRRLRADTVRPLRRSAQRPLPPATNVLQGSRPPSVDDSRGAECSGTALPRPKRRGEVCRSLQPEHRSPGHVSAPLRQQVSWLMHSCIL